MIKLIKKNRGLILSSTLVFASIAVIVVVGLTAWFGTTLKGTRKLAIGEKAFQIAEAGVEYYKWRLNHFPSDFQDGTGDEGPYVHDFFNKEGEKIGEFSLEITPPAEGTSLVVVRSTGTALENENYSRTIEVELDKLSLSEYAFISNADLFIRPGATVSGAIHSNGGIRVDGLANNLVTSAKEEYDDPEHSGENEFGVHTHIDPVDPLPPADVPSRPDVFVAGRQFPVPAIDFDSLTITIAEMKSIAQDNGLYFEDSSKEGYRVVLKTDDTFDLYMIDKIDNGDPPEDCKKPDGLEDWEWSTWSVEEETFVDNYDFPENGVIYFEDDVWVEGQIDTALLTIVVGRFPDSPSQQRSITINNDLLYTNYDGSDMLGLIAQKDINVGMASADDLRIDAAMIAKAGRIGRHYFPGPEGNKDGCSPYHERNSLTILGMIASYGAYGFAYTDGTGYQTRNITYDSNLTDVTPPFFPDITDQYQVVSWREIR